MSELDNNDEKSKPFKIIMVGQSSVGKSSILIRYIDNSFKADGKATIGLDYRSKKVEKNGESFNLELWDSAGQEKYRTIVFNYFRMSKAGCVVFDITNPASLEQAKFWFKQLEVHCGNNIVKVLVGNKIDLLQSKGGRESMKAHMEKLGPKIKEIEKQYDARYFMVSALTGQGISQLFAYIFDQLYTLYTDSQQQVVDQKIVKLPKKSYPNEEKKKTCC